MASTVLPNGIIIPEKYSRDWYADLYHNWQELDNLLGGGTPKDGTLTIQKNGTTVGTFSANQATDDSIDLSVPTKTSDLTNDSGFITEDSSKIPLAGSNQISGDLIPSTDGTVNLGSPSYQWNNAYIKSLTINGVACGDILTHNASEFANDADVVHVRGSDGIIDSKTFISLYTQSSSPSLWMKNTSFTMGTAPTTNRYSGIWVQDNNGTDTAYIVHQANKNNSQNLKFSVSNTDGTTVYQNALTFQGRLDGTFNFYSDNPANLGTSTNKWKSLNGINPGALSLPSSTYINVDTTNWDLTCQNGQLGSFTPTADGWLMLSVDNSGTSEVNFWIIGGVIRINNKSTLNTSDNNNFNMITIPVEKDVTYNIYGNASEYVAGRSIAYCRFMPCRGNI